MSPARPLLLALLLGLAAHLAGCDSGDAEQTFEPAAEVGFHDGGGPYEPVAQGGDWLILHGFQGGLWTMPTLRVRGLDPQVTLGFVLETDAGEVLSDLHLRLPFTDVGGGWRERRDLPVAVEKPVSQLADVVGRSATASWTFTDESGRTVSLDLDVVLREGEAF